MVPDTHHSDGRRRKGETMSKGSEKVTIRLGASFRHAVEEYCETRKNRAGGIEPWTFSDFVIQAILDKLNHIERSKKSNVKWSMGRIDENGPRRLIRTEKKHGRVYRDLDTTDAWTEEDVRHDYISDPGEAAKKLLDFLKQND